MYIQYVGSDNSISSRIYTFHVIDPPRETRKFSVKVRSEEFCPGRLKFQDGPGISSARLQRELKGETQESRAEPNLGIEELDVREYRAHHYPQPKPPKASDAGQGHARESSSPITHLQQRGYSPLSPTRLPAREVITILLLHEVGNSRDALKLALEGQSVNVRSLKSYQEALPTLTGEDPPHLVFTQPKLPDGIWADVVSLAVKAAKPVNVIVVGSLPNVGFYLQVITGGAFDFIVPPLTGYELTHVMRCAIEDVLSRRDTQARSA